MKASGPNRKLPSRNTISSRIRAQRAASTSRKSPSVRLSDVAVALPARPLEPGGRRRKPTNSCAPTTP
jgi:hypothetical protein